MMAEYNEPISSELAALLKRIDSDFTYHASTPEQVRAYAQMRDKAKDLATDIAFLVPIGREQSNALTRLEEAIMHANAGLARAGRVAHPRYVPNGYGGARLMNAAGEAVTPDSVLKYPRGSEGEPLPSPIATPASDQ
jgi:hypothetical protein